MKNALVDVRFKLNIPEGAVSAILSSVPTADYEEQLEAIAEAVRDDLPLYLEYGQDEPDVEVLA